MYVSYARLVDMLEHVTIVFTEFGNHSTGNRYVYIIFIYIHKRFTITT